MIPELAAYDIPFSEIEERVMDWVAEALELRHGPAGDPKGPINGWGSTEDTPRDALDLLLRVKTRSDRIGELLSKVTQAKARAKRAQDQAQFQAEIAYAEAMRNNAARRADAFVSARERDADASLDSLEQRRIAHHAARLVSITTEAYDVVSQTYWQLEAIRKDVRATIHALQFESSLER